MQMIKINLLPYRERRDTLRRQRFMAWMALALVSAVLAAAAAYRHFQAALVEQDGRNSLLQQAVDSRRQLLAAYRAAPERATVQPDTENTAAAAASLLQHLAKAVPEGVYLSSLKSGGQSVSGSYQVAGYARDDAGLAELMRRFAADSAFGSAALGGSKAENGRRKFELNIVWQEGANDEAH